MRSGRYQASFIGPDTARHYAPTTFATRTDAGSWLDDEQKLLNAAGWTPPKERQKSARVGMTLRDFVDGGALDRRRTRGRALKPRTLHGYRGLLDRVILPELGGAPMHVITADQVAAWYDGLPAEHSAQRGHAYALLRSLFEQAISENRVTMVNPCRIKGAGVTRRARKIKPATLAELQTIVEASPEHVRALLLTSAWCGLRFGELAELRRRDVDLKAGVLSVGRGYVRVDGRDVVDTPKSDAGVREVAIPPHIIPMLEAHLKEHTKRGPSALVFTTSTGRRWTQGHLYKHWMPARETAGRPDLRVHDLRHTAAVLAAQSGATLADLMARLGHSTPAAAMRYQHTAQGRDAAIALALSQIAGQEPDNTSD